MHGDDLDDWDHVTPGADGWGDNVEWDKESLDPADDSLAPPRVVAAEAHRTAANLTADGVVHLTWDEVMAMHRRSKFVDPRLTQLLGTTRTPTWVVYYHSDEFVWTVAKAPGETEWVAFFGYALPWDPDEHEDLVEVTEEDLDVAPVEPALRVYEPDNEFAEPITDAELAEVAEMAALLDEAETVGPKRKKRNKKDGKKRKKDKKRKKKDRKKKKSSSDEPQATKPPKRRKSMGGKNR